MNQQSFVLRAKVLFKHQMSLLFINFFLFSNLCSLGAGSSDDAVIERVLLGVVCPVGRGHAAVRVQQDAETTHDEQGQEDEEQQHEDERRLLFQRQVGGHVMAATRRGQRAAEEALGHPGHIHA